MTITAIGMGLSPLSCNYEMKEVELKVTDDLALRGSPGLGHDYWDLVSLEGDHVGDFIVGSHYSETEKTNIPWIKSSRINSKFRGHGYGRLAMKVLIRHYGVLRSDLTGNISQDAEKAWKAIGAKRLSPRNRRYLDRSNYVMKAKDVIEGLVGPGRQMYNSSLFGALERLGWSTVNYVPVGSEVYMAKGDEDGGKVELVLEPVDSGIQVVAVGSKYGQGGTSIDDKTLGSKIYAGDDYETIASDIDTEFSSKMDDVELSEPPTAAELRADDGE